MKIVNIEKQNLHILWMTWEISMRYSGQMWLIIILNVKKSQGFTLPPYIMSLCDKQHLSNIWGSIH